MNTKLALQLEVSLPTIKTCVSVQTNDKDTFSNDFPPLATILLGLLGEKTLEFIFLHRFQQRKTFTLT